MAGGSKSKRKGNGAELELCKILGGYFGETFTRVPNSGAFLGKSNSFRKSTLSETQIKIYKGDLICPDSLPHMILESKFYQDFTFHQLIQQNDLKLLDDWIQQCYDILDPGDTWFVCFKINRRDWYIVFEADLLPRFQVGNHACYKRFVVTQMKPFLETNVEAVRKLCGRPEAPAALTKASRKPKVKVVAVS